MSFTLGTVQEGFTLRLHRGSDFAEYLDNPAETWVAPTYLQLRFPAQPVLPWSATTTPGRAEWYVPRDLTDLVADGAPVELWEISGLREICLYEGKVVRSGDF